MSTIIRRGLIAVPLVLAAWIGIMAAVMRVSDAAPGAVVPFPTASVMQALPGDTAILGMNRFALTVENRPGMADELYRAGAWLVLPAGLTGCLPLTEAQRRQLR
jgi:hypothetical protein